jgi:hypothetical protein
MELKNPLSYSIAAYEKKEKEAIFGIPSPKRNNSHIRKCGKRV